MTTYSESVNGHYSRPDFKTIILDALRSVGKDTTRLTYSDLTPFDHFHSRGRAATIDLAKMANFPKGAHILDAGGGMGGAARTLAAEFGLNVTVLDLTAEFCRVGQELTELTGLTGQVTFKEGSALDMPFADASFDGVWTQHSTMNIEDKETLYTELHRVLRPGGRLAMHEIMAGAVQPVHFPVPWASTADISFLRPVAEMRALIAKAGFKEVAWQDITGLTVAPEPPRPASDVPAGPPIGLHQLFGENFQPSVRNMMQNLAQDRTNVIMAVFEKA